MLINIIQVFSGSTFFTNIARYGAGQYFPDDSYHIIADSAFPIRTWLMTPFRRTGNMDRIQRNHNYCLSSDRVIIENSFAALKGRWRKLQYINTYSISKAIEIVTAACILHNFCILTGDLWNEPIEPNDDHETEIEDDTRRETRLGKEKRDEIAWNLINDV